MSVGPLFTVLRSTAGLVLFAASAQAAYQLPVHDPPCVGWLVDRTFSTVVRPAAVAVAGDRIVQGHVEHIFGITGQGWLEVHEFDPARDRYVLTDTVVAPGWDQVQELGDTAASGSLVALQPRYFQNSETYCDVIELTSQPPRISQVELPGYRPFRGKLTAIAGGEVLAANMTPGSRPLLHVLRQDSSGEWRVEQTLSHDGIRFRWPLSEAVWLQASTGRAALSATRFVPNSVVAVVYERQPNGRWTATSRIDRPPHLPAFAAVAEMAFDGETLALAMYASSAIDAPSIEIFRRQPDGTWTFDQTLPPHLSSSSTVYARGGRLAVSNSDRTLVLSRDGAATYRVDHEFRGLGKVVHLDAERIAGVDYLVNVGPVRVHSLEPSTPREIEVCRDRGIVVCEPTSPPPARLRAFLSRESGWQPTARFVAHFEGGIPGSLAYAFFAYDVGWNPVGNGALCISGASAVRGEPSRIDGSGNATVRFPVDGIPYLRLTAMPIHVQGLVVGPHSGATNALRVVD